MSETSEDTKITFQAKFADWLLRSRKQLGYLSHEIKIHPGNGFSWWLKNRQQFPEMEQAVLILKQRAEQQDFKFNEVYQCFNQFNLRDDDLGHAEWYAQADSKISALINRLEKGDILVQGIFRGVISELKYITEADDFHKRWGLVQLQQKVTTMYQHLLKQIDELKTAAVAEQQLNAKKLTIEEKKIELEKINSQKEALQLQKEKAEIQREKVIQEKLYREAKRDEHLESQKFLQMQETKQQNEADEKRRLDLQNSYSELADQWDNSVKTGTDNAE